jgi:hypothetical protein
MICVASCGDSSPAAQAARIADEALGASAALSIFGKSNSTVRSRRGGTSVLNKARSIVGSPWSAFSTALAAIASPWPSINASMARVTRLRAPWGGRLDYHFALAETGVPAAFAQTVRRKAPKPVLPPVLLRQRRARTTLNLARRLSTQTAVHYRYVYIWVTLRGVCVSSGGRYDDIAPSRGGRFVSLIPYGKKSCATVTPMHNCDAQLYCFQIREVGTIVRIDESRTFVDVQSRFLIPAFRRAPSLQQAHAAPNTASSLKSRSYQYGDYQ